MNADGPLSDDRPRYQQVADTLRERIGRGEHPPGSQLPTESELCGEFAISRHTAREALRRLADLGLIQRRQGSGSLVVAREPAQGYAHTMRSLDELFQYASDTTLRVLATSRRAAGAEFTAELGPAAGSDGLVIEGLRLDTSGRVPICFSLIFVNADFEAILPEVALLRGAIYRHVEQRFGVEVAEVEQLIRVEPVPAGGARALGLRPKAMGVRVSRRYLDAAGRVLIVSVNWHPAERFSYAMRLRREGARPGRG